LLRKRTGVVTQSQQLSAMRRREAINHALM
jgi:hypothetical protein